MPRFQTCPPHAAPADAVVVNIWHALGRVVGDVGCAHCPNASDYIVPDFPRPVPLALERAEEVRAHCGLARVVIAIDDPSLWKAEWGALLQAEGVH
ncbi:MULTISPECIES: hypothetical protein [unclassified Devosia]|uniref:hypothetical protein n=1 Tax=unclassified Devosia TaxID=196773 RepID=UPI000FDAAFA3|nr:MULTISPECIES: hypothetical protein [unclassified Devosia]